MNATPLARGALVLALSTILSAPALAYSTVSISRQWTNQSTGTAEIVAYDSTTDRYFVVNPDDNTVDVLDGNGNKVDSVDTSGFGPANSVSTRDGKLAIALEDGGNKQANGQVWVLDTNNLAGAPDVYSVGALPDMVTFTPDGNRLLVANEGEPNDDYTVDPEGTVSIIDLGAMSVTSVDFNAFDGNEATLTANGVRLFSGSTDKDGTPFPAGTTVSQDLEPEYIAVSPDGSKAFVTLQEANAVAVVDIASATIEAIHGLGYKDHSLPGNELDASNQDGNNGNLQSWPILGMYQPDAIASYVVNGATYYLTANEGDSREYEGTPGFVGEDRVKDLALDLDDDGVADVGSLQDDDMLGRLKVTVTQGDIDGDGLFEELYSYGARSFSIWDAASGALVWDSGAMIESIIASQFPEAWVDGRSDDKGPEPEAITIAQIGDFFFALVGLERTSGFMIFDVTDPFSPSFLEYVLTPGDIGPEGIDFHLVSQRGRGGWGYITVANEVSGTTTRYQFGVPVPGTLALVGLGLIGLRHYTRSS